MQSAGAPRQFPYKQMYVFLTGLLDGTADGDIVMPTSTVGSLLGDVLGETLSARSATVGLSDEIGETDVGISDGE